MKNTKHDHQLGQAGVYRVSSELLLRGVETFIPSVDLGCDLRTPSMGVQVKSANLFAQTSTRSYYYFGLEKGRERRVERKPDFHVLWGRDEDRFWIVPSGLLAGKMSCATPNRRENNRVTMFSQWEGKWEALTGDECFQRLLDGEAGTQRVISELLLRHVNPSRPVVDEGVDLCAGGLRLQIKTARLTKHQANWDTLVYGYNLNTHLGRKDRAEQRNIKYSDYIDFFIFMGIEQNRFWIIPATELDGRDRVFLGNDAAWIPPAESIAARATGKTYQQVADEQGISLASAWRKVNGEESGKFEDSAKLREYEGKWDLICEHANLMAAPTPVLTDEEQKREAYSKWIDSEIRNPSPPNTNN